MDFIHNLAAPKYNYTIFGPTSLVIWPPSILVPSLFFEYFQPQYLFFQMTFPLPNLLLSLCVCMRVRICCDVSKFVRSNQLMKIGLFFCFTKN